MSETPDDFSRELELPADESHNERLYSYNEISMSTNAPGLRPNWLRLAFRSWRWFLAAIVPTAIAAFGFYWVNYFYSAGIVIQGTWLFLASTPFALLALFLWWLAIMVVRSQAITVSKGLLSPAIVSIDRKHLFCLTNLSCDEDHTIYGLKAIPFRPRRGETDVPCACTFVEGTEDELRRWADFNPFPLRWGSSQSVEIEKCSQRIPPEMWKGLKQSACKLEVPTDDRMLLLDEDFRFLEEVNFQAKETGSRKDDHYAVTPAWVAKVSTFFIAVGLLVLVLGSFLLVVTPPVGNDGQWLPWRQLVPLVALPGLGLMGIATGIAMHLEFWRVATVSFLIGIGLAITLIVFSPLE